MEKPGSGFRTDLIRAFYVVGAVTCKGFKIRIQGRCDAQFFFDIIRITDNRIFAAVA